jgi:hypothetical protein|tara:strand:- start:9195 stop:9512 length:318 start_codon:yes stop_codon:yes gene_type:complete
MLEENDDTELDLYKDLALYNEAMYNAYLIITKEKTVDDIYYELESGTYDEFYLPFNPIDQDGRDTGTIDLLLEHFEELEDYEKCAKLVKIKDLCSKTLINSDLQL